MVAGPVVCSWVEQLRLALAATAAKLKEARVRCFTLAITGHYEERRICAIGFIIQPHDWEPRPNEQMLQEILHVIWKTNHIAPRVYPATILGVAANQIPVRILESEHIVVSATTMQFVRHCRL